MKIYLNLLSEERKEKIYRKKRFHRLIEQEILLLLPVVIFSIMLVCIMILLSMQLNSVMADSAKQSEQGNYKELNDYENSIKDFNANLLLIQESSKKHLQWTKYFHELIEIMPEGVRIKEMSTKEYQVFMVGAARNREAMMGFKKALEESGCFSSVNVPLSNLVAKDNIDFQIDVTVKNECLASSK